MQPSLVRRLLVPTIGGAVASFLIVGVLIADLSTRHEGAEPASILLGFAWLGPWALLVALPVCSGLGLTAGALSLFHGRLPPRLVLGSLFAVFLGLFTTFMVTFFVPFLWLPSGLVAILFIVATAAATAWITFPPKSGQRVRTERRQLEIASRP